MSEWISVKDRLPPRDQMVIVVDSYGDVSPITYCIDDSDIDEPDYWTDCLGITGLHSVDKFTHWMPLPAPPKGGDPT